MRTWEDRAACAASSEGAWPVELFQTSLKGRSFPGITESFCSGCTVQAECLADGWWDEYAVRGGMVPRQRAALSTYLRWRASTALAG